MQCINQDLKCTSARRTRRSRAPYASAVAHMNMYLPNRYLYSSNTHKMWHDVCSTEIQPGDVIHLFTISASSVRMLYHATAEKSMAPSYRHELRSIERKLVT